MPQASTSTSTSDSAQIQEKRKGAPALHEAPQKKTKLTDYYVSESSMELRVTRMAASDGIPLSKFCTSEDLRYVFKKSGYDLPKSPSTITRIVLELHDNTKNALIRLLKEMKSQNKRFTMTFDEWTSTRNKRYMNINIHSKDLEPVYYKNLGLVRIEGSMPADVGTQLLQQHLNNFGLSLEDIIAFTTDGASVMVKMGKNFDGHHQLCFAHGIQLAVLDVLYKSQYQSTPNPNPEQQDIELDYDSEDSEENYGGFDIEVPRITESEFLYKDTIKKVRDLVKSFKKSPLKNDLLQKYSVEEYEKGLDFILDCKTRWNSLSDMIGRFLKLKSCVMKALLDLKSNINFTEKEIQDLQNIHHSLDVIKTTVMSLCRRDSNLLTADAALQFMLNKLDHQHNELSERLANSLRKRIKERRTSVSGILQYLHNNEQFYETISTETFTKPTSDYIRTYITRLLERLKFTASTTSAQTSQSPIQQISTAHTDSSDEELTVAEELEKEICKATSQVNKSTVNTDLESIVRVEMCIYDTAGGGRGFYLTAAYNYLLSITPTSVEAERAFSSAGYLCSKLRSSLSDKTLNALSFMRSHFQEKSNK